MHRHRNGEKGRIRPLKTASVMVVEGEWQVLPAGLHLSLQRVFLDSRWHLRILHKCTQATLYELTRTELLRLRAPSPLVLLWTRSGPPAPEEHDKPPGHRKRDPLPLHWTAGCTAQDSLISIHSPPNLGLLQDVLNYEGGGNQAKHIYVM